MYDRFLNEPVPARIGRGKQFKRWLKKIYLRLPMCPLVRFVYAYCFRLGFLDGKPGLVSAPCWRFMTFWPGRMRTEQRVVQPAESFLPESAT